MLKIVIIIINFNGLLNTINCLTSLKKITIAKDWQLNIVVIDNSPKDKLVKQIKKNFPQIIYIQNKNNLGFSEGSNKGISYALKNNADYILLLNNDTIVDRNFLKGLVNYAKQNINVGIISPKIYFALGFEYHKSWYQENSRGKVIWYAGGLLNWPNILPSHRGVDEVDKGQYNEITKTDFATGCCMLIKRKVFEKIGLFDKKYFLYWEDIDFCQRAKKAGFKIVYVPHAKLWHKNASSSGGAGASLSVYYQTRNRLLFAIKYASLRSMMALFRQALIYLFKGTKMQKKAVRDFFVFKFGQLNRG